MEIEKEALIKMLHQRKLQQVQLFRQLIFALKANPFINLLGKNFRHPFRNAITSCFHTAELGRSCESNVCFANIHKNTPIIPKRCSEKDKKILQNILTPNF